MIFDKDLDYLYRKEFKKTDLIKFKVLFWIAIRTRYSISCYEQY